MDVYRLDGNTDGIGIEEYFKRPLYSRFFMPQNLQLYSYNSCVPLPNVIASYLTIPVTIQFHLDSLLGRTFDKDFLNGKIENEGSNDNYNLSNSNVDQNMFGNNILDKYNPELKVKKDIEANSKIRQISFFYVVDTLIKDYLTNNALCNQIAEYFNLRIIEYFPSLKTYFKFKDIFLYEVQNFPSRYLIGSNDVNEFSPISWNKLTKNAIDAFTHFSYQFTEGNLIITNIEYDSNNNIITNYTLSKLEDNAHGTIMKFFVSHYCNDICKKLKLVHPRKKKIDFTLSNEFYYHHIISGAKLCQLCKIPIYSKDNVCVSCIDKKNKSMKKAICSECHNVFSFSGYYYNVKMMNYPTKCDNCTFRF